MARMEGGGGGGKRGEVIVSDCYSCMVVVAVWHSHRRVCRVNIMPTHTHTAWCVCLRGTNTQKAKDTEWWCDGRLPVVRFHFHFLVPTHRLGIVISRNTRVERIFFANLCSSVLLLPRERLCSLKIIPPSPDDALLSALTRRNGRPCARTREKKKT